VAGYVVRRILVAIPTLIGISILIFFMVRLLPGDIVSVLTGGDIGSDPTLVEKAREQLGLNGSYPEQYWRWVSGILHGDLGFSLRNTQPVSQVLLNAIPITFELVFLGLLIAVVIGSL
jgi:peptide/nickel transport system permease protein